MPHEDVLGLSLFLAREILLARGLREVRVTWTRAPRDEGEEGSPRVVALREEGRVLVAARFLDAMPEG